MKILYHHRIASNDGQAVHVEEIIKALRLNGHTVLLVGPRWIESRSFGFEGGIVSLLKKLIPGAAYELLEFCYNIVAGFRLATATHAFKPDIIYERYNLFLVAGVWWSRVTGVPLLLEINAPLFAERAQYGGIKLRQLARWTERYAWCSAAHVLPVTEVLAAIVRAEGVSLERITTIPNGIDPEKFPDSPTEADMSSVDSKRGHIVLGFTGFVRDWHKLENLVDVVAADTNRTLLIVGDGPARRSIEQRALHLGVEDRVRVTGVVGRTEVAAHIASFDIALQPDVVDYASPLKLFEYLAMGRAIVAPDKANILEVLTDNDNALLFPAGNHAAMVSAIERLCSDASLRLRLGRRARATIGERRLTWRDNARSIVAIAESAIVGRHDG